MLMVEAPMGLPASVVERAIGAAPGGLPKPPARPPAEPIIIKVPPRPHEAPEVDRPDEGEDNMASGGRHGCRTCHRHCRPKSGRAKRRVPARRMALASGEREAYITLAG